ncbi:hydroxymethylpyrimidine/phosphomethylpyrimidine kinase [Pedobacter faecalis]|uniref:hydroxymethylpyrimidine/phosphomethylpyrimidine kinase n=1 Tax=Pedobacter faecalis TaxID=3041495 RepID=UPI0025517340|nr:hydroxymethylpyrimidine/phosphomethylpyrimidine kinase [Pedobacter sp. ELA7]
MGNRPYALTIAGLDPSAGAGLLADVKCFEQHEVYAFGACSALTVQTDDCFIRNQWLEASEIIAQVEPLARKFKIVACKIGIIKDLHVLLEVTAFLRHVNPSIYMVWDPVISASTGYQFHPDQLDVGLLTDALYSIDVITPNYDEIQLIKPIVSPKETACEWSEYCAVLLKGGHNPEQPGTDYLYIKNEAVPIEPALAELPAKHGSGCVLSAAITANLALGNSIERSCRLAKHYTEKFLASNQTLLGYHTT